MGYPRHYVFDVLGNLYVVAIDGPRRPVQIGDGPTLEAACAALQPCGELGAGEWSPERAAELLQSDSELGRAGFGLEELLPRHAECVDQELAELRGVSHG